MIDPLWFPIFFVIALLYSVVGLGGGSSYVAFLTISGIPHVYIPGTALGLNLMATALGFTLHKRNFPRGGWKLVLLFGLAMLGAWIGSRIVLPSNIFYILLGGLLVLSSLVELLRRTVEIEKGKKRRWEVVLSASFLCALLAAMVGIGGGIFLAPILLISGFSAKESASITSLYIALNSAVGFSGHLLGGRVSIPLLLQLGTMVLAGAAIGSFLGSRKLPERQVRLALTFLVMLLGVRIILLGIQA